MTERHDENANTPQRSLEVDWALYESYLAETDLTEAEKRQFLEALWSIILGFVDLGFGIHPAQQACGQSYEKEQEFAAGGRSMLDFKEEFPTTRPTTGAAFRRAAKQAGE